MFNNRSLLDLSLVTSENLGQLFSLAESLKSAPNSQHFSKQAALIFFEPSTRTRLSFEMACVREGVYPLVVGSSSGTSLEKGESFEDTLLNVNAMNPDFFIIRCGDHLNLEAMTRLLKKPILNAGWGKRGHPTQALLDTWTLHQKWGSLKGKKILIVGDVVHSRVAASHFELGKLVGYQVGVCAPPEMMVSDQVKIDFGLQTFSRVEEALQWADAVITLRVQLERHASKMILEDYISDFGLTKRRSEILGSDKWIMHPGPINHGVEIDSSVLSDPRCLVLEQVQCGVYIRQALIHLLTGVTGADQ